MTTIEKAILAAIIGIVLALIVMTVKSEIAHADYVLTHKCKELSRESRAPILIYHKIGDISYPQFIEQPDEVTYSCDNGQYVH